MELKVETNKCKTGDKKSVKCRPMSVVPSDEDSQMSGKCSSNPKVCNDNQVCLYSTIKNSGHRQWNKSFGIHVIEAKQRGLLVG